MINDPAHHPGEDLLWDYHRGALKAGLALVVRTHLDLCPHCREEMRLFDSIGGAMFEELDGVPLSDSALDLALARIERPEEAAHATVVKRPAFLEGFELSESLNGATIRGRYWAAPGVWMAPIEVPGADRSEWAKTYLMFVKGGMVMPEHTHRGNEITVVLKGSFDDGKGEYRRGDLARCTQEDCHSPAIGAEEDCLCLVWQDAPIIPRNWLGRLLQPFARI